MKMFICLLVIGLTLACCKSKEKIMYPSSGYVSTQPVELRVQETVRDTIVIGESEDGLRQEDVIHTEGAELMRYCIIVGSFIYQQNAINLRNELMRQGFLGTSIMRNSEGMYRVSVICGDNFEDAQAELSRIRCQYPRFRDAWLLECSR